jgi:hypothetical protein
MQVEQPDKTISQQICHVICSVVIEPQIPYKYPKSYTEKIIQGEH